MVCIVVLNLLLNLHLIRKSYLGHDNMLIPQINVLRQKKLRLARTVEQFSMLIAHTFVKNVLISDLFVITIFFHMLIQM